MATLSLPVLGESPWAAKINTAITDVNTDLELLKTELPATIDGKITVALPAELIFSDDFTTLPNANLAGRVAPTGQTWIGSGPTPPKIVAGGLVSDGTGYAWMDTGTKIRDVEFEFEMRGTGTDQNVVLALAKTNNVIDNLIHFSVNNRQIIVDFLTGGSWSVGKQPSYVLNFSNRILDGRSYRVRLSIDGETATITGPHGERMSFADNRVKNNAGTSFFLEPLGATAGRYPAVLRVTAGKAPVKRVLPLDGGHWLTDGNGRVAGNRFTAWETSIGRMPSGNPGIMLGGISISAILTKAHNIGDTVLETDTPIPSGATDTYINPDTPGGEMVTASGNYGGTGPFTRTVTALTKAHPIGTRIYAVATKNVVIDYNPVNGLVTFPNGSSINGSLYFGTSLDAALQRGAAGVIQTGSSHVIRTGRNTTANRPSASAMLQGSMFFDTTLNKPIWSNGTAWVDATGAAV